MICPYYKNSEVFNGFNEIIEALGGRPMTEEEFRDPELRNQRSGTDYSAMEATYRIYNRNGGNMLDMTPQGKPSVLFQTLLDHFGGDRQKAIVAKSNVYSDEFANWFGDWWGPLNVQEDEDIKYGTVSKVVDENGEPLVVWHGTRKRFEEFDKKEAKSPSGQSLFTKPDKDLDKAFYFTDSKKYSEIRGIAVPVYLNLKHPFTEEILKRTNKPSGIIEIMLDHYYDNGKFQMHTETVADAFSIAREVGEEVDGIIGIDMDETDHEFDFAVKEPNQVKHVENLGTWSP